MLTRHTLTGIILASLFAATVPNTSHAQQVKASPQLVRQHNQLKMDQARATHQRNTGAISEKGFQRKMKGLDASLTRNSLKQVSHQVKALENYWTHVGQRDRKRYGFLTEHTANKLAQIAKVKAPVTQALRAKRNEPLLRHAGHAAYAAGLALGIKGFGTWMGSLGILGGMFIDGRLQDKAKQAKSNGERATVQTVLNMAGSQTFRPNAQLKDVAIRNLTAGRDGAHAQVQDASVKLGAAKQTEAGWTKALDTVGALKTR